MGVGKWRLVRQADAVTAFLINVKIKRHTVALQQGQGDRGVLGVAVIEGQAGGARTVEGMAPLNVVIGVADAVKVAVNDREIVMPRRANRDSTRFVVSSDGSVR